MRSQLTWWSIRIGIVCAGLFLFGYCLRDFWFGQLRIYLLGFVEVRAEQFGHRLPGIDEIEVIALGTGSPDPKSASETELGYPVHARAVLQGGEAQKVEV